MRYLVSIVGMFGFMLVLAVGLLLEKPLPLSLVTALVAAVGFALLCQWWTQLVLMSYRQAIQTVPAQPVAAPAVPAVAEPRTPLVAGRRASRRK